MTSEFNKKLTRLKLFVLIALLTAPAYATPKIETKEQADAFLETYCAEIVSEIALAVDRQKAHASIENREGFLEQGAYISGLADVYGNL
jgi:hypothetical protein